MHMHTLYTILILENCAFQLISAFYHLLTFQHRDANVEI